MFDFFIVFGCTVLQLYVFNRTASVPALERHVPRKRFFRAGAALWAVFVIARIVGHWGTGSIIWALGFFGMTWMSLLLLISVPLLAVDLATGFGFWARRLSPSLRGWALAAGGVLFAIALVQGMRAPVVERQEVPVAGLPAELDKTVIVVLSDLHIGSSLDRTWLEERIGQVLAERPDLVVLLGDFFEGHGSPAEDLLPVLSRLRAPLGVWAVTGNHELYGDTARVLQLFRTAGFHVLRNRWEEIRPGLILVGVDDLSTEHRRGRDGEALREALLLPRPPGATILLSHTPWQTEQAAAGGVSLMLSGHTHGGQIWPAGWLIRFVYPLVEGLYTVGGMPVIVTRGAGTWGPRVRLWRPGQILRVTLRAGARPTGAAP